MVNSGPDFDITISLRWPCLWRKTDVECNRNQAEPLEHAVAAVLDVMVLDELYSRAVKVWRFSFDRKQSISQ